MTRYCVIGAGAAGLSALQELRDAGFDVDCFEKSDRVGGHWHTDYDALHLITSRDMTHFEGFPMPAHYPHFPRRDQVRKYIESYARHHGLYDVIGFNTAVKAVAPLPNSRGLRGSEGWQVTLDTGETRDYDGVLIANGHLWDPKIPQVDGHFTGTQIHSGQYKNTSQIKGQRVLVVGAGNSGCDLAADAAQHRFEVDIVIREGVHFQPKTYFGVPRQEIPWLTEFSPSEQDLIARLLARVSIGESHNYPGMPQPQVRTLAEGRTVVNDLLLYWIQHGRVGVVPGISRFEGKRVVFSDGSSGEYDTILWATGFNASLPFLADSLIDYRAGAPVRYGAGIVPQGLEKLYFIGMIAPRGPQIPIYGRQAQTVIRMLELHASSEYGSARIAEYLESLQESEDRIDIVRDVWIEQLEDTERLLTALHAARSADPAVSAQR